MIRKAGKVLAAAFSGTPKKAIVAFGTPFPDTNYAVNADACTMGDGVYVLALESKTASGFTINLGSDDKTDLSEVGWQALENQN